MIKRKMVVMGKLQLGTVLANGMVRPFYEVTIRMPKAAGEVFSESINEINFEVSKEEFESVQIGYEMEVSFKFKRDRFRTSK
jgi:hypothetical protein